MNSLFGQVSRALMMVALLAALIDMPVRASRGVPGSPEFAIGARLIVPSNTLDTDISFITSIHPDWLSIQLNWNALTPESGIEPDWCILDAAIDQAAASGSSIMLSLTDPPAWVVTGSGPSPELTADFVLTAARRYNGKIQALELFPSPNTRTGWVDAPNPDNYLSVYQAVTRRLSEQSQSLLLVSGSLETNVPQDAPEAWSDLDFLAGLYAAGANTVIPVIGLRFTSIAGLPSAFPNDDPSNVLRHYEVVRKMMTSNGHVSGLIWITYLSFASGTSLIEQTEWLAEAYAQIRSQLYIGAAFLQGVNTCEVEIENCNEASLLLPGGEKHPYVPVFRGMLANNAPNHELERPGRLKSRIFNKPK
jgi:hypothetical protein